MFSESSSMIGLSAMPAHAPFRNFQDRSFPSSIPYDDMNLGLPASTSAFPPFNSMNDIPVLPISSMISTGPSYLQNSQSDPHPFISSQSHYTTLADAASADSKLNFSYIGEHGVFPSQLKPLVSPTPLTTTTASATRAPAPARAPAVSGVSTFAGLPIKHESLATNHDLPMLNPTFSNDDFPLDMPSYQHRDSDTSHTTNSNSGPFAGFSPTDDITSAAAQRDLQIMDFPPSYSHHPGVVAMPPIGAPIHEPIGVYPPFPLNNAPPNAAATPLATYPPAAITKHEGITGGKSCSSSVNNEFTQLEISPNAMHPPFNQTPTFIHDCPLPPSNSTTTTQRPLTSTPRGTQSDLKIEIPQASTTSSSLITPFVVPTMTATATAAGLSATSTVGADVKIERMNNSNHTISTISTHGSNDGSGRVVRTTTRLMGIRQRYLSQYGYLLVRSNCYHSDLDEERSWCCPDESCTSSFKTERSLQNHFRKHTEFAFRCETCGKCFARKCNLNEHIRVHTGERPFKCTQCSTAFKQKHCLTEHMRSHSGEKPYECTICHKRFSIKHNLKTHTRIHTQDKTSFACVYCRKSFRSHHGYRGHMKKQHSGVDTTGTPPYSAAATSTSTSASSAAQ